MHRRGPIFVLGIAFLAVLFASCANPFGYYVGENRYPLTNQTAETTPATAVSTPVFYAISTTGGSPRAVVGTPTERTDQEITIHTTTGDALVYYTYSEGIGVAAEPPNPVPFDGKTLQYDPSHPILVSGNNMVVRVKAIALKPLMIPSSVTAMEMRISYGTGTGPSFDAAAGVYQTPFTLTISDLTPDAVIWYTTDGSEPVPNDGKTSSHASPVPLDITASTLVRAVTTAPQLVLSSETAAQYLFTPGPPSSPSVTVGPGQATLAWPSVAGAVSYNLYYRAGATVTPSDGTKAGCSTTTKTVGGLAGGTQYAFAVTALNANGESLASSVVAAVPLLPAPSGFAVSPASSQAVRATWSTEAGAASYEIFSDISQPGSFTDLMWSGTGTEALVTGLYPGTGYSFRIQAVDQAGTAGGLGDPVTGTTYSLAEMPTLANVPTGSLPAPTQLPAGQDPASDYWVRTGTLGWTEGGYTYAVWEHDLNYSDAFIVVAYDATGAIAAQWMFTGNSQISSLSVDPVTGNVSFVNDWDMTTTVAPWSSMKL